MNLSSSTLKQRLLRKRVLIPLLAVIVLAVLFFCYQVLKREEQTPVLLPFSADTPYAPFSRGVLSLESGGRATLYDRGGAPLWSVDAPMDAQIAAGDHVAALYNDALLVIVDEKGALRKELPLSRAPQSVRCSSWLTAVLYQGDGGGYTIDVYDSVGLLIDRITHHLLSGEQAVVDFGFDGKTLYALTLDTSGAGAVTHVLTFDPQKKQTTGSFSILGSVAYRVLFDEKLFYLIGTNEIVCYNYLGESQWSKRITGYKADAAGMLNGKSVFVLSPLQPYAASTLPEASVKLLYGETEALIPSGGDARMLFIGQRHLYVLSGNALSVCRYRDVKLLRRALPFAAERATLIDGEKTLVFEYDGRVYSYRIA
ncbi:MAG: hypothetical protein ACOX88_06270 [Christensenellales bacterium]|jgi:hypothetical protein